MASIPAALAAINTLFKIGSQGCPQTYALIANVGDLSGPSVSGNVVDVTSHSTGSPWREKIVTLLDAGEITLPLFFIPSSSGPSGHSGTNGLLQVFTERQLRRYSLTFPDAAGTTYWFNANITKFNFTEPVAGVVTANVTFTLTGEPDFE